MTSRTMGARRGAAFRPSAIFLGIFALWVTGAVMAWMEFGNATFNLILFVLAGWVVSLSLHEYAHALFAYRAGDHSVVGRGYLTLNPLKYTHPVLSIGLPLLFLLIGGIGLPGGAVWVDRHAVRGKVAASLISAVGPGANVVLFVLLMIPFALGLDDSAHPTFWAAVAFLAFLQLTAAVLNLLPVPGLDGGNITRPWLSPSAGRVFDLVAPFGMVILLGILFVPVLNDIFWSVVLGLTDLFGLPRNLVADGLDTLQFWR